MSVHNKYTDAQIVELKNIFLRAYEKKGLYHRSAEVAGLTARELEELFREDPTFKEEFEISKARFTESLEDVAVTRAKAGESDSLLQFLLRANKPEKYNPSVGMKVSGSAGARVMLMFSEGELTEEEKKLLTNTVPLEAIERE